MIELYQLQQLLAFDKFKTLTKATEELHISQPALTRSMQKLEEELHVKIFERTKNKLTINENGKITVEYAKKVIEAIDNMVTHVQTFDRANRTIAIGSCAPAPLWELLPELSRLYPDMTISSDLKEDNDVLLDLLENNFYNIIIMPYKLSDPKYICKKYMKEQLNFCVPSTHKLANKENLYFKDIDGENMIIFSEIGFWHNIHISNMPNSRFLIQNDLFEFDELVNSSILPCFSTDMSLKYLGGRCDRINIPITDPSATVFYYLICLKEHSKLLDKVKYLA